MIEYFLQLTTLSIVAGVIIFGSLGLGRYVGQVVARRVLRLS